MLRRDWILGCSHNCGLKNKPMFIPSHARMLAFREPCVIPFLFSWPSFGLAEEVVVLAFRTGAWFSLAKRVNHIRWALACSAGGLLYHGHNRTFPQPVWLCPPGSKALRSAKARCKSEAIERGKRMISLPLHLQLFIFRVFRPKIACQVPKGSKPLPTNNIRIQN